MSCTACGAENRSGRRFCGRCGAPLPVVCGRCGFGNEPGDAFCGGCGAALGAAEPTPAAVGARPGTSPAPPPAGVEGPGLAAAPPDPPPPLHPRPPQAASPEGQRRQVSVLFADMKGYTPLSEALGEEGAYRLMDEVYRIMTGVVDGLGGTVQELTGDGILALFGAPRALEDAPVRACQAALDIQRNMRAVSERLQADHGAQVRVRIGINTGPVVVATVGSGGRVELKAIGDTVNVAARLEALAEPGTVLLSEATHALVADLVEAADLGEREMKGKRAPQRAYRLDGLRPGVDRFERSRQRGLTPLVGRADQLQMLERHWLAARAGRCRAVHVVGEAGIGKTRIVHELRARLEPEGVRVLAGHCSATGTATAFLPFIEVLRQAFRVGSEDGVPVVTRKLVRGLTLLGIEEARVLPYLLNLLGIDPEGLRELDGEIIGVHTREALGRVLREACRLSPTLLVLDDVHWLDRASEQLLDQLLHASSLPGLLLICTQRPEYRAPWAGRPEHVEVKLEALPRDGMADLVRRCVGEERMSEPLLARVIEASGGNPLFAEEMARYLAEQAGRGEAAVGPGPGRALAALPVPSSLQGLVMARVDRLDEGSRRTLQVAAVVGRRFPLELVARIAGLDGAAAAVARELEALGLIGREEGAADAYAFRHVLLQEAIYHSLLTPQRRALHRQVGEVIEQAYPDRLGEWVDALARHFAEADEPRKAAAYLARAGEKSLRVYALEQADEYCRRSVELIDGGATGLDDHRLAEILVQWAHVHYYRRDFRGQVELVERYLPRIEALGPSPPRAMLLFWLSLGNAMRWRLEAARTRGEQALALAEAMGDETCIGYACMALLYSEPGARGPEGRRQVEALSARAVQIATRRRDVYLLAKSLWGRGLDHLQSGRVGPALRDAREVIDRGREAGDPRTVAMGLWGAAHALNVDGRAEEALDMAEEALRVSPDALDRMSALAARGSALALLGRTAEAIPALADVRRDIVQHEFLSILAPVDGFYGMALVVAGRLAEGTRWIEAMIRQFEAWGAPRSANLGRMILGETYLHVLRGPERPAIGALVRNLGWLVTRAPFAERHARATLEAAARVARDTGAGGIEAWALADLAILGAGRRRDEARRHLAEAERLAPEAGSAMVDRRIAEARSLLG